MGTGNDLSRALGWGAGSSALDAHSIIHSIKYAEVHALDRYELFIFTLISKYRSIYNVISADYLA